MWLMWSMTRKRLKCPSGNSDFAEMSLHSHSLLDPLQSATHPVRRELPLEHFTCCLHSCPIWDIFARRPEIIETIIIVYYRQNRARITPRSTTAFRGVGGASVMFHQNFCSGVVFIHRTRVDMHIDVWFLQICLAQRLGPQMHAMHLQIVDFIRQQNGPSQFGNPPLACEGGSRHYCSVYWC